MCLNGRFFHVTCICRSLRALAGYYISLILLCLFLTPVHANGIWTITPGTSTNSTNKSDTITLNFPDPNDHTKTIQIPAKVTVLPNMSPGEKAGAIYDAIHAAIDQYNTQHGTQFHYSLALDPLHGQVLVGGATCVSITDRSGSGINSVKGDPRYASTSLALQSGFSALAGIDGNGDSATYAAGFDLVSPSMGNLSLFTSLNFADLTTPTVDGILQQEFSALQSQLQVQAPSLLNDLTLDLSGGEIDFLNNADITSITAIGGTTDQAVESGCGVCDAPEPSTGILAAAGVAFGAVIGFWRRGIQLA